MAQKRDKNTIHLHGETQALLLKTRIPRKASQSRRHCGRCCTCCFSFLALVFLVIGILAILLSIDLRKPVPTIGPSLESPGIGFDLGPDHATAAIRHPNGTKSGIARITYEPEWIDMMKRLSERKHFPDPYEDYCHGGLGVALEWKYWWRLIKRNLGLPTTKDVALLSKIVGRLKRAVEEQNQGVEIETAMITAPMFPQLCQWPFKEAARLNGIAAIPMPIWPYDETVLHELEATYVGYGMGLCRHYTNVTRCHTEEDHIPSSSILSISYAEQALSVSCLRLDKLDVQPRWSTTYNTNWTLGSLAAPPEDSRGADEFWHGVRREIMQTVYAARIHVDTLFFIGEGSGKAKFRDVVEESLMRLQGVLPKIFDDDTIYMAAEGAAEMAKREGDGAFLKRRDGDML